MFIINHAHLHLADGNLFGEASTLGLAPGQWPRVVVVTKGGASLEFIKQFMVDVSNTRDDFGGVAYAGPRGEVLVIHND